MAAAGGDAGRGQQGSWAPGSRTTTLRAGAWPARCPPGDLLDPRAAGRGHPRDPPSLCRRRPHGLALPQEQSLAALRGARGARGPQLGGDPVSAGLLGAGLLLCLEGGQVNRKGTAGAGHSRAGGQRCLGGGGVCQERLLQQEVTGPRPKPRREQGLLSQPLHPHLMAGESAPPSKLGWRLPPPRGRRGRGRTASSPRPPHPQPGWGLPVPPFRSPLL